MPTNTIIRLPLHVRGDYVLQVVARVAGEPYRLETFGRQVLRPGGGVLDQMTVPVPFDEALPPGKDNPWHVRFERRRSDGLVLEPSSTEASMATLKFHDAAGQAHGWYWHTDDEMEQFKTLRPGAHALAVAVGRRLVRFFGGNLTEADLNDAIDYAVPVEQARLPPMRPEQTSDDRWYQFHALLHAEGLLSQVELREAMRRRGARPEEEALLPLLPVTELAPILEKRLPPGQAGGLRHRM